MYQSYKQSINTFLQNHCVFFFLFIFSWSGVRIWRQNLLWRTKRNCVFKLRGLCSVWVQGKNTVDGKNISCMLEISKSHWKKLLKYRQVYLRKWQQKRHLRGPVFILSYWVPHQILQINLLCIATSFDYAAWQSSCILSSLGVVSIISNKKPSRLPYASIGTCAMLLFKMMCSGTRGAQMWWGHNLKFSIIRNSA